MSGHSDEQPAEVDRLAELTLGLLSLTLREQQAGERDEAARDALLRDLDFTEMLDMLDLIASLWASTVRELEQRLPDFDAAERLRETALHFARRAAEGPTD